MRAPSRKPTHRPLGRTWRERRAAAGVTPDGGARRALTPYARRARGPEQPPQVAEQRLARERLLDELGVAAAEAGRGARSSVWPVMNSTFTPGCSRRAPRRAPRPFMRGMTTSVRRRSTRPPHARGPPRAPRRRSGRRSPRSPSPASTRPSSTRSASSSSASTTVSPRPRGAARRDGDASARRPARRRRGRKTVNVAPRARPRVDADRAARLAHDAVDRGEAEARALPGSFVVKNGSKIRAPHVLGHPAARCPSRRAPRTGRRRRPSVARAARRARRSRSR